MRFSEEGIMDGTRRGLLGLIAGAAAAGSTTNAWAAGAPTLAEHPMVARVWHGRTPLDKADVGGRLRGSHIATGGTPRRCNCSGGRAGVQAVTAIGSPRNVRRIALMARTERRRAVSMTDLMSA